MIVQSFSRKKYPVNGFKPLANYLLRLELDRTALRHDAREWGLSQVRETEPVAWAAALNCASPNLGWAIEEIECVQRVNIRATTCKNYHYVISFPEGETPPRDVLTSIERDISTEVGYRDHQRLLAVHRDTPNLHMHVAVNRVHPQTFLCVDPGLDHNIMRRMTVELEQHYGLQTDSRSSPLRNAERESYQPAWQEKPVKEIDPLLLEQFKQEKQRQQDARSRAMDELRERHRAYVQKLAAWHKQRRENAKAQPLNRADKISTSAHLRDVFQRDHDERTKRNKQERDALKQAYPVMTSFEAFVLEKARSDDERVRKHVHQHVSSRNLDRQLG